MGRLNVKYSLAVFALVIVIVTVVTVVNGHRFDASLKRIFHSSSASLRNSEIQHFEKRAEALARFAAQELDNSLLRREEAVISETGRALMAQDEVKYVYVFDRDGVVVFDGRPGRPLEGQAMKDTWGLKAMAARDLLVQTGAETMEAVMPVFKGVEYLGGLRVGVDMTGINNRLDVLKHSVDDVAHDVREDNLRFAFSAMSIISLLGLLAAAVMMRRLTRPIEELSNITRRVGEGEYDLAIPVERNDEIGELAQSFGGMLEKLKNRDKEIRTYQSSLESLVEERTLALARSSEEQRAVLETSPDAIIRADTLGIIRSANNAAFHLFGYGPDELEGEKLSVILPLDNQGLESAAAGFSGREESVELQGKRQDGKTFPAELSVSKGEIEGLPFYVVIARDVTIRKKAEESLIKARDQAEEVSRTKSEFLANMSHELRTPLTGIIGFSRLLSGTSLSREQEEYLKVIRTAADNLLDLINEILDLSKIESGRMELERLEFNLRQLVDEAVTPQAAKAQGKGLEFIYRLPFELPTTIIGDPTRLRQIIINLVHNAIKFTEQGHVLLAVDMEARDPDRVELHFRISDTGIGIPEEKLEVIFESFRQADGSTTRRHGGTGLGTTIARNLAEIMGGKLWVESKVNEGTTFHFVLPFGYREASPTARPAYNVEGRRVLLADANPVARETEKEILERHGMEVHECGEGGSVLPVLEDASGTDRAFDLLVADQMLPGRSVDTLLEAIEGTDALRDLPSLLLMRNMAKESSPLREAASGYLVKPVKPDEFMKTVESLVMSRPVKEGDRAPGRAAMDAPSGGVRKQYCALVVEDNQVNQMLVSQYLEGMGCNVHSVDNGEEAFDLWRENEFDILILDIQLPGMDGLELARKVRENEPDSRHTAILAVTAHAMTGDREKALESGMDDYIAKPIDEKDLKEKVNALLKR